MSKGIGPALAYYAAEVSRLIAAESSTEATYYPAIKSLLEAVVRELQLNYDVRASTSELRQRGGRDLPDFAFYDGAGDFVVLFTEVKLPTVGIEELAQSEADNDQVGRYLASTGAVLLWTLREVAVVTPKRTWRGGDRVPAGQRQVGSVVEFWPTVAALRSGDPIAADRGVELSAIIEETLTRHTPIASPETLARVLARQARRATTALPSRFTDAVGTLQQDFAEALGITFADEEGEHFFRSSLVQTVYYGIFAGWLLHASEWRSDAYDWRRTGEYLRIPFLAGLFHEIQNPVRLRELGFREHLDAAAATLARVNRDEFFRRLRPSAQADGDGEGFASAIVYFYEPFLAAFDPELREQLGVWYTPPEIVRYQVRRVDSLLRTELGCPRGLADERVVVLDPACGTGAYLLETLRCIAETLRAEGIDAELAATLRNALQHRIIGFEILTAPFVVTHLQLYLLLSELGAPPDEVHRAAVFLTNALTGWHEAPQEALHFPELQQERDAAQRVKQEARIVVVLGNPPYNRFAAAAVREEQALIDPYKGIRRNSEGEQLGQSELWTKWRVRKQLLDDLYIRFFRLAEECIGIRAEFGIVSFISNSSYLIGRSHPIMRESLLRNFDDVWIDNLNGDKYKTGKVIPEGAPGAGGADASAFVMGGRGGIQVGTAISTWLKRARHTANPEAVLVRTRDFWGDATRKRQALVESLGMESWTDDMLEAAAALPEGPRAYEEFHTSSERRWKLLPYESVGGYEEWPSLDQLFTDSVAGVNLNRGLNESVIDMDRAALTRRMERYFSDENDAVFFAANPELGRSYAGYTPSAVRQELRTHGTFAEERILPYQLFPLDARWLYYEPDGRLLNRPRPELAAQLSGNEFLVVVNEARRVSETKPLLSSVAFDLHLFDVGAQAFFAERNQVIERALDDGEPEFRRVSNVASVVMDRLTAEWLSSGQGAELGPGQFSRSLFRLIMAIGHSPDFQRDFSGSLAHDWMRVPIPKSLSTFRRAVALGDTVSTLLDPTAPRGILAEAISRTLGLDAARLAQLARVDGQPIRDEDLLVRVAHFGAARGGWKMRMRQPDEPWYDEWGEETGDLWINDRVFFRHVPDRVWRFQLGGYTVLKKWLGYRESRRLKRPLSLAEKDHLRSIVQRIAALLVLEPQLNACYEQCASDSFTAAELGVSD